MIESTAFSAELNEANMFDSLFKLLMCFEMDQEKVKKEINSRILQLQNSDDFLNDSVVFMYTYLLNYLENHEIRKYR